MYNNYVNLVDMMIKVGRVEEVDRFKVMADQLKEGLWAGCYPLDMKEELGEAGATYMEQGGYILPGGLVTSEFWSGQQWDALNCWAPLQHLVVSGLLKCGGVNARRVANKIAVHFVMCFMAWCNREGVSSTRSKTAKTGGGE
jgi:neutral trehalase